MKEFGYVFEDHTADVQVKSWGRNLEEAFSQTALSLNETISPDLKKIKPLTEHEISINSEDKESLLFDFLSEFLYIFDVEGLIFSEIYVESIKKEDNQYQLKAKLKGEKFDKNYHEIGTEVKAITYSFLEFNESENKVEIRIVFDI